MPEEFPSYICECCGRKIPLRCEYLKLDKYGFECVCRPCLNRIDVAELMRLLAIETVAGLLKLLKVETVSDFLEVSQIDFEKDGTYSVIEGNTSLTSGDNGGCVMRRTRYKSQIHYIKFREFLDAILRTYLKIR